MSVRIKNCGISTPQALREVARTGAHYVGFIHHLASPRHVTLNTLATLAAATPDPLQQVVVLVDPSLELLDEILSVMRPHFWQVHRVHSADRVRAIEVHTGIPVITAISVRDRNSLTNVPALEEASAHVLFDTHHPHQEGGSGTVFDWSLLRLIKPSKPWFLAGGLTADNVAEAIAATHAPMVDVSSGIESAAGKKSLEKIAAFNAAAQAATVL